MIKENEFFNCEDIPCLCGEILIPGYLELICPKCRRGYDMRNHEEVPVCCGKTLIQGYLELDCPKCHRSYDMRWTRCPAQSARWLAHKIQSEKKFLKRFVKRFANGDEEMLQALIDREYLEE